MLKPDKAYKEYIEKADAGISFLDAKIKEKKDLDNDGREWLSGDVLADEAKAPEFLINNIIETNSHGIISGSSQAFKTFLVVKLAHSVCTGIDFFGHDVFETGKVLYICGEGKGALARRIKALKIVEGGFSNNLFILNQPIGIDNIACMQWLKEAVEEIKPMLVIADTFSSLATSTNENDNSEVARTLRLINDSCTGNKTCSLVVHHYGKDAARGVRGAYAFQGNVDYSMTMERIEGTMKTKLVSNKMKDSELFDEMNLEAHVVDLGMLRQDGQQSTSLILKLDGDAVSNEHDGNGNDSRVYVALKNLGKESYSEAEIREIIRQEFHDYSNHRVLFKRIMDSLISKNLIKNHYKKFLVVRENV